MKNTMRAVVVKELGAQAHVAHDLPIPEPGEGQVLVKSIYTAINPVYASFPSSSLSVFTPSFQHQN